MIQHANSKPQKPKQVLILGGNGFVGANLIKLLESKSIACKSLSTKDCDLTKPESTAKLIPLFGKDVVVVFASAITPDRGRDAAAMLNNVMMAMHVSAAINEAPCQQLIYISSDAVYSDDFCPIKESSPAEPPSLYGTGHKTREKILESACLAAKTPLLCLRPCAMYGFGDTHNSYGPNKFISSAKKDKRIGLFGEGEERKDHLYIKDFCKIIEAAINLQSHGLLNVATGSSISFFEVASMVQKLLGDSIKVEGSARQGAIVHRHFDTASLIKAFPSFTFTSLHDGLTETLKSS